jgi:hypothetical protein
MTPLRSTEDRTLNFGEGGTAYLFFREIGGRAEGWSFWQCV